MDSSNNIIDSKSETKITKETTLGNTFNLVKWRGEGVPNSNAKGAISQKILD